MKIYLLIGLLVSLILISGCSNSTELKKCISGDYEAERHCYTSLAYNKVDYKICEKMPTDVNERQTNKAFCLGFIASVTGDLRICRNQKNTFYANVCERIFQRYGMLDINYIKEFEELKKQYRSQTQSNK